MNTQRKPFCRHVCHRRNERRRMARILMANALNDTSMRMAKRLASDWRVGDVMADASDEERRILTPDRV